ncbi:MAG TPA: NAD(P)/FAD-dependent oxidoreductase [Actinomycetota bacterium]
MALASNPDVIVIGAGFAGLAAALDLQEAGLSVAALEARERVGGRAWTVRLPSGEPAELGGEWIFDGYDEVEALAGRFGLEIAPAGVNFDARDVADRPVDRTDLEAFLEEARRALDTVDSVERERRSVGAFLRELAGPDDVRAAVRARWQGTCASDLDDVALSVAGELIAIAGGPSRRFARGATALAEAIASRLLDLRLRCTVTAIEDGRDGIEVALGRGEDRIRTGAVVAAIPLPRLRTLWIDPPPPPEVADALVALGFGPASKLVVPLDDEPAPRARQSVAGPWWWWTALGDGGRPRRCVTAFAGSPAAQAALETDRSDPGPWLERLGSLDPELRPAGEATLVSWAAEPFTRGGYTVIRPGSVARLPALERPFGRVVLAGEHTAGLEWHGTFEGAVRSGRRAARDVLAILDAD